MAIEVGTKLQGKVTGITNFGAFVELPDGVTGLVHISEIADNYVKDIHDFLKVNDVVTVKVLSVESDGKIGLSIRQASDNYSPENNRKRNSRERNQRPSPQDLSFEDKLTRFMKDSDERLATLKRYTEGKRGNGKR